MQDFRSENGLYSLIQAQFDTAQQQAGGDSDADTSDASIDQRPAKRQRRQHDGSDLASQGAESPGVPFPGLRAAAAKARTSEAGQDNVPDPSRLILPDGLLPWPHSQMPENDTPQSRQDTIMKDEAASASPIVIPVQGPELPMIRLLGPEVCQSPIDNPTLKPEPVLLSPHDHFPSSPPGLLLGTPHPRPRPHLLDTLPGSSSPLSSPPPVTFDPYQESSNCPSDQDTASSRSESEEPSSVSTPLLSSQTSFTSSRASLPIMKGRDLFDAQIWACPLKTSVFYTFVSTLRDKVKTAEPTSSHRFVSVLRDTRKLVRCYTQNIDQLEERVGLSTSLSLGVGSRYRFSVRAGRSSTAVKGATKGPEGAPDASQASQPDEEQQGDPQPENSQHGPPESEGGDNAGPAVQLSQAASDGPTPEDIPSSTAPPSSQPSAPPAPNRGVECVFLHGSLAELRCFVCARTASWDEETRLADTLAGRQPTCPHCAGATAAREERGKRALGVGKLRPDIVLYGEDHPHAHLISPLVQHDLSLGPDMLLILGTSMRVHGLKVLVKEFAKAVHDRGGKVVFVNLTKPPESVWADVIDYWVQWDCDAWVGDLQERKPALWLPPGTALSEEEKQKMAKLSRRQSGAEPTKRKDGTEKTAKKSRESDGLVGDQKREGTGLPIQEEGQEPSMLDDMPPPSLPLSSKVGSKRVAKVPKEPKEPKLNPDAKRPASVRDHKLNGAYLVWKITEDLQRITGRSPPASVVTSPQSSTAKPKTKRPRKSAPAALESQNMPTPVRTVEMPDLWMGKLEPAIPASSPLHKPLQADGPVTNSDNSISAAVKSRKRKQAVTWRVIRGVETRVSINDAGEVQTVSTPASPTIARPPPVPKARRLPSPTPTPSQPPQYQDHVPPPKSEPQISAFDKAIEDGFRETDRLIAQMHQEASRPATPQRLPPLKMFLPPQHTHNQPQPHQPQHHHYNTIHPQQQHPHQIQTHHYHLPTYPQQEKQHPQHHQPQHHPPTRPPPIEPPLAFPAPHTGIPSNVASPVFPSPSHTNTNNPGNNHSKNPFSLTDPGSSWLGYPPAWMRQHHQKRHHHHYQQQQEQRQQHHNHHQREGLESEKENAAAFGVGVYGYGPVPVPSPVGLEIGVGPGGFFHGAQRRQHAVPVPLSVPVPVPVVEGAVEAWGCPDEQLRKEQEAALMLSALSGRGGLF